MNPADVSAEHNPLRSPIDYRLNRIAGPSALIIFGVTGDLSRKKLMPAVYDLANRGLLPPGFGLVGFARRDWEDQDFMKIVHDSVKQYARTEFREEVWTQLAQGIRFVPGDLRRRRGVRDASRRRLAELDRDRGTMGNHAFYLSIPPKAFPQVTEQLRRSGLAEAEDGAVATRRHREALRQRPEDGARAEPVVGSVFPPGLGVPDRPLPGQGDCAEHPRAALRQPALRAHLERQLRRPRADHDGRGHRRRRSCRLLRRHRRGARRHPEPPAAAARADRDGGADLLRGLRPARREGEGARRRATAGRPRRRRRPAASTPAAGRAARRSSASSRKTA